MARTTTSVSTGFVDLGPVPMIVDDCPLYALKKKWQCRYPNGDGKWKMVCMMGFLQIKTASQECVGSLLAASDWDKMFTQANIFTFGWPASLLGGKHVKGTYYVCHLIPAWLHRLMLQTYAEYCQLIWGPMKQRRSGNGALCQMPRRSVTGRESDYLVINSSFVTGQWAGDWSLILNACYNLCPLFCFVYLLC